MSRRVFLLLAVLFGCSINADKKVTFDNFDFRTGDDTELFFKNVRQPYYELEENKAAGLNIFRLEDRVKSDSTPILNVAIVINYLQDRAFLLLEPNGKLESHYPLELVWKNPKDGTSGIIKQSKADRDGMFKVANRIYQGISSGVDFFLKDNTPILKSKKEREAFRVTLVDYYKLTRLN